MFIGHESFPQQSNVVRENGNNRDWREKSKQILRIYNNNFKSHKGKPTRPSQLTSEFSTVLVFSALLSRRFQGELSHLVCFYRVLPEFVL